MAVLDRRHADERVDHVLVIAGSPEFLDGVSHLIARAGRRVNGFLRLAANRAAIRVEVGLGDGSGVIRMDICISLMPSTVDILFRPLGRVGRS